MASCMIYNIDRSRFDKSSDGKKFVSSGLQRLLPFVRAGPGIADPAMTLGVRTTFTGSTLGG